jgi:APA family basic amino acid/polyamine antiporter
LEQRAELPRKLGLFDSTSIVIGTMVGSAIFLVPSSIAQSLPSAPMILSIWVIAGVLSLLGALAYAELGAMMPATGGQYVFLRESFGPMGGFLCGWSFFLAARSGGIAVVAVGFSIYLSYFLPLTPVLAKVVSCGLILFLSWVNYRGIRVGATVQNVFTSLKVLGLALLIGSAFLSPAHAASPAPSEPFSMNHFGVAMIAGLWAYNGWFAISLVAGEVRNPQRNLPLSLMLGVTAVIAIYLLANLGYMRVFTIPELAATERVASATAQLTMGHVGAVLVSLTILISMFGTTNGNIMTASRLYFAQARDGLFFETFGYVHPRFETPAVSILGQAIWSSLLALSGSYEVLFSYSTFTFWIFYAMTVAGVMILRRKYPTMERPYKMWGYPVTPVIFVAVAAWFVANTLVSRPGPSLIGLGMIASGVPAYYAWRWRELRKGALSADSPFKKEKAG